MLAIKGQVYMASFCVDMRKSIDGLSILVAHEFHKNPTDGAFYVFINKALDKIKILYFDKNGFALWYKRLEKGKFKLPKYDGKIYTLDDAQLRWLLDGLDIKKLKKTTELSYESFS
jgi:transposase